MRHLSRRARRIWHRRRSHEEARAVRWGPRCCPAGAVGHAAGDRFRTARLPERWRVLDMRSARTLVAGRPDHHACDRLVLHGRGADHQGRDPGALAAAVLGGRLVHHLQRQSLHHVLPGPTLDRGHHQPSSRAAEDRRSALREGHRRGGRPGREGRGHRGQGQEVSDVEGAEGRGGDRVSRRVGATRSCGPAGTAGRTAPASGATAASRGRPATHPRVRTRR